MIRVEIILYIIDNKLYQDQYRDNFDKGILLYKIINLGDIYE